jgi:small subunit ribosomal protein S16
MYRNHLKGGIAKGALTQEQADAKFAKWEIEKEGKISGKITKLDSAKKDAYKNRMTAEVAAKDATAAKVIAKNTPPVVEAVVESSEPETPQAEAEA